MYEVHGLAIMDSKTAAAIEKRVQTLQRKSKAELIAYAEQLAPGEFDFRGARKSDIIAELIGLQFSDRRSAERCLN